jgi:hypothetical protein
MKREEHDRSARILPGDIEDLNATENALETEKRFSIA